MQYTESSVSMQKSVSVRSALFYTECRLVIQRIQEGGSPAWTGLGARLLAISDVTWFVPGKSLGGTNVLLVTGLIRAFSVHIHVFMWAWAHGPKGCSSHQQSRGEPGISLLAVTPEAPLSPTSSLAYFYQYDGISKSALPHRNPERTESLWSMRCMPYMGTAFPCSWFYFYYL